MYQKVILHLSTGRKIPQQKFFICPPHAKQNQKIHTYILSDFFSNLCTFNSYCQKILKKAYLHQIKQICKKNSSKKSFKKVFFQHNQKKRFII